MSGRRRGTVLYMVVSRDELELPEFCGSCRETAEYLGINPSSLRSAISRSPGGRLRSQTNKSLVIRVVTE